MSKKYLISSMENEIEQFYSANPDGTLYNIGRSLNWDYGFDDVYLSEIPYSVYSTLTDGKLYVNESNTIISEYYYIRIFW